MKKILLLTVILTVAWACSVLVFAQGNMPTGEPEPVPVVEPSPIVTQLILDASPVTGGYVVSSTMFAMVLSELQGVYERVQSKDKDIEILVSQKREKDAIIEGERSAKDLLIQEKIARTLGEQDLLLQGELTPEEKQIIEDTILGIVAEKAVPIVKEPILIEPIIDEPIKEVLK